MRSVCEVQSGMSSISLLECCVMVGAYFCIVWNHVASGEGGGATAAVPGAFLFCISSFVLQPNLS